MSAPEKMDPLTMPEIVGQLQVPYRFRTNKYGSCFDQPTYITSGRYGKYVDMYRRLKYSCVMQDDVKRGLIDAVTVTTVISAIAIPSLLAGWWSIGVVTLVFAMTGGVWIVGLLSAAAKRKQVAIAMLTRSDHCRIYDAFDGLLRSEVCAMGLNLQIRALNQAVTLNVLDVEGMAKAKSEVWRMRQRAAENIEVQMKDLDRYVTHDERRVELSRFEAAFPGQVDLAAKLRERLMQEAKEFRLPEPPRATA